MKYFLVEGSIKDAGRMTDEIMFPDIDSKTYFVPF